MTKKLLAQQTILLASIILPCQVRPALAFESPRTADSSPAPEAINKMAGGLAVSGYDVVAYFDQKQAIKGSDAYTYQYKGATYRFMSEEHLAAFAKDPEQFLPQYGGFCAYGAAQGHKAPADPEAWTVIDGKLYLNYNKQVQKAFLKDTSGKLSQADANWQKLKK
jgi:YHS domain-containing protein